MPSLSSLCLTPEPMERMTKAYYSICDIECVQTQTANLRDHSTQRSPKMREVKMGYILSFDESARALLISFEKADTDRPLEEVSEDSPFHLKEDGRSGRASTKTRPDQTKFKYEVMERYGSDVPYVISRSRRCCKLHIFAEGQLVGHMIPETVLYFVRIIIAPLIIFYSQ